jgi:4-oxalocrotonate tautomerase family enzyme
MTLRIVSKGPGGDHRLMNFTHERSQALDPNIETIPTHKAKEHQMPIITCDIRNGRTKEQKHELAIGLTNVVAEATGCGIDNIFLVIREMPGFNFVDAGEHVPDYVPGPDGIDLAGHEQLKNRQARQAD